MKHQRSFRIKEIFSWFQFQTWTKILLFFGVWKALTFLGIKLGQIFLPYVRLYSSYFEPYINSFPYIWRVMGNFDGQQYLVIASMGYLPFTQAFFPLYPLLIRLGWQQLHVPFIVCGLIISHFSFLFALYVVYQLFQLDNQKSQTPLPKEAGWFCIALIVFFPTAQFYGAVYNDALYFLFATMTLWLGRSRHWFFASIFGGLATLTRLNGLALWPFLVFEFLSSQMGETYLWDVQWWRKNISQVFRAILTPQILLSCIIPAVFLGYLVFHQLHSGSWQVVFSSMKVWKQEKVTFPPPSGLAIPKNFGFEL